jgi:flagellin
MVINDLFGLTNNNNFRMRFLEEKTATERLSSGLQINHSADDPSGLAIASSNRAIIGGLDTAIGNVQDGIKMLRTADGALAEIGSLLQRGRDIAVRAANEATLSSADLDRLQAEIDNEITPGINQIANTTTYNSKYLINGGSGPSFTQTTKDDFAAGQNLTDIDLVSSPGSVKLQPIDWSTRPGYDPDRSGIVGNEYHFNIWLSGYVENLDGFGNPDGTVTVNLNVDATKFGGGTVEYEGWIQLDPSATINSITYGLPVGSSLVDMGGGLVSFEDGVFGGRGIKANNSATANAQINFTVGKDKATWTTAVNSGSGGNPVKFYYGSTQIYDSNLPYSQSGYFTDMTPTATFRSSGIDTGKTSGNATITWNGSIPGGTSMMMRVYESGAAGGPWNALGQFLSGTSFDFTKQFLMVEAVLNSAGISSGSPSLDDFTLRIIQGKGLQVGEGSDAAIFQITVPAINATAAGLGVSTINVRSFSTITEYNNAINSVSDLRGELGVLEKQLNGILNTLTDEKINYAAANSRIMDADFAKEFTDMTRTNILSQSTLALSAQGDPLAQGVLSLFDRTGVGNGSLKTPNQLTGAG